MVVIQQKKKGKKSKDDEYDTTDKFVDDSTAGIDEPQFSGIPAKAGFYVCKGDVILQGEEKYVVYSGACCFSMFYRLTLLFFFSPTRTEIMSILSSLSQRKRTLQVRLQRLLPLRLPVE